MNKYGYITLKDYERALLSCVVCHCGLCAANCPAYISLRDEAVSPRGLAHIAFNALKGEIDLSEIPDKVIYACTGCGWCEWDCSQNRPLPENLRRRSLLISGATIAEILRSMKVERGEVPEQVAEALNNLVKYGNPFGKSAKIKDDWVASLGVQTNHADVILYVGSLVPYDELATKMAEALVNLLKRAGLKFGMLGSIEADSGAFARAMGEEGLFMELVDSNTETFKKYGVKRIICLSPHDYDVFLRYYDDIKKDIEIKHYTQVLWELIENNKIELKRSYQKKVTYHDPCYLGRRNNIFDEPRNILKKIPGLDLVEMKLAREEAFCCGGGGTGLFYRVPEIDIDLRRAEQAKETGAEVIAVACPICLRMLNDAVKSKSYEIEVKDIAQIVNEVI